MAMTPKPTPKPKIASKPKVTPKPKVVPTPKFTAPSLQDYKKSAAYTTNTLTYKEYVAIAKDVYKTRLKKRQGQ